MWFHFRFWNGSDQTIVHGVMGVGVARTLSLLSGADVTDRES